MTPQNEMFIEKETGQIEEVVSLSAMISEQRKLELVCLQLRKYPAGTVIDCKGVDNTTLQGFFYCENIKEDVKERMIGYSYGENCDIPFRELSYLRVLHYGFDHQVQIGELVVNQKIAQDIIEVMQVLFAHKYPIEKMFLVDEYEADDIASMEDNNSSAFNYRHIDGTTTLSQHSLGLAIDINPLYNPYVRKIDGETVVLPIQGTEYTDREREISYYIKKGDVCYQAFLDLGFTWGGDWNNSKDYQHFQKTIS